MTEPGALGDGEAPLTRIFMEQLFGSLWEDFATLKKEIAAEVKDLKGEVVDLGQRVDTLEQTCDTQEDNWTAQKPRPGGINLIKPQQLRAKRRGWHYLEAYAVMIVSQRQTQTNDMP
ncbi:hypothetical protein NDU88_006541 [Pleurodeles waltl]|uniref:Uncharacterized protein n=1 Tax=Pleurodeles waltl TaxID=8319 RepID=A0AAV7MEC7_PLEWA|nr:hypothetical protein NDU88_006541 [Pleurodeles waltl]